MKNVLHENKIRMTMINISRIVFVVTSPPVSVLARRGSSGGPSSTCTVAVLRDSLRCTTNRRRIPFD